MRRRSVGALVGVGVGAVVLAAGGYAVGAERQEAAGPRHEGCRAVGQEFSTRAGQLRKQLAQEAQATEVDGPQFAIDRMRAAVLAALVQQNPGCFDAGTRATVAVVQRHPTDGIGDAADCALVGRSLDECSVQAN